MRKIILNVAITADGFIEGPNAEIDWCFTDQDYGMTKFFSRIDAVFYGRKSYEMMVQLGGELDQKMDHFIFSTSLKDEIPGATIISSDLKEKIDQIRSSEGKDIWLFGGASLLKSMIQLQLVDELMLAVHPVILGSGIHLFDGLDQRLNLELLESTKYSSGLVQNRYALKY